MDLGKKHLQRSLLVSSIAAVAAGVISISASAQEQNTVVEEVVVTGIRQSLEDAMDIKRDASGVVDAISAEDMGKFPDSNLAESLQRISGVSIDRNNGEGSEITVRGFGPSFNLVTLNGRTMPFAASPKQEGAGGTQTRSFKFDQIASESVSGVNIYKTARADQASGGIGATVDVRTAKPLSIGETKSAFSVKGIMDQTNVRGDDITSEISGMFSTTFADDKFGVLVAVSHSERDSRQEIFASDGWLRMGEGCEVAWNRTTHHTECTGPGGTVDDSAVDLSKNPDANIWVAQNYNMDISDHERVRDNVQVVLQAAPTDSLEMTLDFFGSDFQDTITRLQTQHWLTHFGGPAETDANGTVVKYANGFAGTGFLGYHDDIVTENRSFGFNADWQATDTLQLVFDLHHSTAHAQPNGEFSERSVLLDAAEFSGCGNDNSPNCFAAGGFSLDYSTGSDIPITTDFGNTVGGTPDSAQLGKDIYNTDLLYSNLLIGRGNEVENTVNQFKIDGIWENSSDSDLKRIRFGISNVDMQFDTTWRFTNTNVADQRASNLLGFTGATFLPRGDVGSEFSGSDGLFRGFVDFDPQSVFAAYEEAGLLNLDPPEYNLLNETTTALYAQFEFETEFNDLPVNAVAGIRYESTDVTGTTRSVTPYGLRYLSSTELRPQFRTGDDAYGAISVKEDYAYFLPNLDVSVDLTEDLVARFSAGRTMTRNDLTSLRPSPVIANARPGGPYLAFQGNPGLLPYISDNVDVSVEWYFDEGSYASVGYFKKWVDNYATTTTTTGPFLNADGVAITDPSELDNINVAGGCPVPAADGNGGGTDIPACDSLYDGSQNPIEWQITTPENSESAEVDGVEIAFQKLFGETGFGMQANATFVNGDISYDVFSADNQVALTGLSDSYNLVGFYENYGFQARLAYNWRDKFLLSTDQLRAPNEPVFTEEYGQLDLNVSYDVNDNVTVFLEGLNILEENLRQHGRFENQLVSAQTFGARYNLGLRANF